MRDFYPRFLAASSLAFCLVGVCLLSVGCRGKKKDPKPSATPPAPVKSALPHDDRNGSPVLLSLKLAKEQPKKGLALIAVLECSIEAKGKAVMSFSLPKGLKWKGEPPPKSHPLAPNTTSRVSLDFVADGWDEKTPLRVTLKGGSASSGFVANRDWPKPKEVSVPAHSGPRPPGGRPAPRPPRR